MTQHQWITGAYVLRQHRGFIFKSQMSILNWSQDDTLVRM